MSTSLSRLTTLLQARLVAQHQEIDRLEQAKALTSALKVLEFMQTEVQGHMTRFTALQTSLNKEYSLKQAKISEDSEAQLCLIEFHLLWLGSPPAEPVKTDERMGLLLVEVEGQLSALAAELKTITERLSALRAVKLSTTTTEITACVKTLKENPDVEFELFTTQIAPKIQEYINKNLNDQYIYDGTTLLHLAVRARREDLVYWMRARGASVLCVSGNGAGYPCFEAPVNFSAGGILQLLPSEAEWVAKYGVDFKNHLDYKKFQTQFKERCQFAIVGNHTQMATALLSHSLCPPFSIKVDCPKRYVEKPVLNWLSERPDHIKILKTYIACLKRFDQSGRLWKELQETSYSEGLTTYTTTAFEAALFAGNIEAVHTLIAEHNEQEVVHFRQAKATEPQASGVLPIAGVERMCRTLLERPGVLSDAHWEAGCVLIRSFPQMVPVALGKYAMGNQTQVFVYPNGVYDDHEIGRLKKRIHLAVFLHFTRTLVANNSDLKEVGKDFKRAEDLLQAVLAAPTVATIWQIISDLLREVIKVPCETPHALRTTLLCLLMEEPSILRAPLGIHANLPKLVEGKGYSGMLLYAMAMFIKLKVINPLPVPRQEDAPGQLALVLQQHLLEATCDYFLKNYTDSERLAKFSIVESDWQQLSSCSLSLSALLPRLIRFLENGRGLRLESHRWCVVAAILSQPTLRTAFGLSVTPVIIKDEDRRKIILKTVITALKKDVSDHRQHPILNNNNHNESDSTDAKKTFSPGASGSKW
jgi:hypothetical protein